MCRFSLVRFMGWLQWTVSPRPFSYLASGFLLLTLLPEGASVHGSCAYVLESGDRKWGRLWCRPAPKFTILVMTVNTNFPVGLQRLRTDFTPRLILTAVLPSSLSFWKTQVKCHLLAFLGVMVIIVKAGVAEAVVRVIIITSTQKTFPKGSAVLSLLFNPQQQP